MADYTRDVKKQLSNNGFAFHRHGKGDHDIWRSPHTNISVSVDGSIKSRHTANAVMKEAGINHRF